MLALKPIGIYVELRAPSPVASVAPINSKSCHQCRIDMMAGLGKWSA
ncbi:MAG: hypothetical protein SOX17_09370 [Prevotella sp.]|nr:hypothetical protein [Prevotella sp.]MDD7605158.1 hypothetical protein [Prevotellaceae bacterium]MDY3248688.1 hypothetical protein [Prevotella sp.]